MMSCDQFREVAPDLALGLLDGGERAAAIGHVTGCASCRRHLDRLVEVADELLLLAPAIEPEIGFESRVIARLAAGAVVADHREVAGVHPGRTPADPGRTPADPGRTPADPGRTPADPGRTPADIDAAPSPTTIRPLRRRWLHAGPGQQGRRWTHPLTVAAVAVLVLAVAAAGWAGGLHRGRAEGQAEAAASVAGANSQLLARTVTVWADHGHSTCQLVAFPKTGTQPAHLVIHLEEPGQSAEDYQVFAVPVHGGREIPVGTITVTDAEGTLTAAIPPSAGPVNAVRVADGSGSTRYWATFAAV